jgi:hypothetical protein
MSKHKFEIAIAIFTFVVVWSAIDSTLGEARDCRDANMIYRDSTCLERRP